MIVKNIVIKDVRSKSFLTNDLKAITSNILQADYFVSVEEAQKALIKSHIKTDLEFICIELSTKSKLSKLDLVLLRNSHLDATHVGLKGNPYFYYCDEETQKDYCLCGPNDNWILCDHSDNGGDHTMKLRSDADKLIPISLETVV